jgi:serine phosphatase RsbU (regulator of sigma subunit)
MLTNSAQLGEGDYQPSQSIIIHGLRAILCAPMNVQDRLIGVVYVDTSLRHTNFTEADRELLSAVAGQAGIAIENARLYRDAKKMGRMERELQMAREIQESLLPSHTPQILGYNVAARWLSANEVAGDFYDVFALGDDKLALVIADVSDKGAPAALFMAAARSMIRTNAYAGLSPQETMARTNDLILEDAGSGMFVTVYYTVFQKEGFSSHVNGGHNPPMFYRHATREISFMPRGGRALGWFPDNPLQTLDTQLEAGDMIVYYTDGLTEAENAQQDYFGEERLMQAIHEAAGQSADAVLKNILARVDEFCAGVPPFDDLTLCVVRYNG